MNPLLEEIYSTIIPSTPYVLAAYVLVMFVLFVWLFSLFKGQKRLDKRLALLEEELEERSAHGN